MNRARFNRVRFNRTTALAPKEVSAASTLLIVDAARFSSAFPVSATDTLVFSAQVSPVDDLGRFQRGQRVSVSVDALGVPDSPPTATFLDAQGRATLVQPLPLMAPPTRFGRPILLGAGLALGTFQVRYDWSVSGQAHTATHQFTLVDGGDSGGAVIALHAYDRPEARYVIAQLAAGKLVQGRNPAT